MNNAKRICRHPNEINASLSGENLSSSQKIESKNKVASSFLSVSTFLENSAVSYGTVHKLWIMLEFEAIKQDIFSELPLDIIVCLDISKSMKDGKLVHLVATMDYLISKLNHNHRICLVAFNQEIHVLSAGLVQATQENKQLLREALRSIQPSGSTNIADALFKALDIFQNREKTTNVRISSIMLFTDGLANVGLRGSEFNEALKRVNIPSNVVINTFGFGVHDSTMLRNIALSSCGGVYHYIPHIEAIPSVFGQCLAGLLNTVLYDVNVSLQACDGCRIVRFCTSYPIREKKENKDYNISFGSMYRYEKKSLLFRISLKKLVAEWENHPLVNSTISFRTVNNGKLYEICNKFQVARPVFCPKEVIPDQLDEQINRIIAAQAFDQAIVFCNKEDYNAAITSLTEAINKINCSVTASKQFSSDLIQDLVTCTNSMREKMSFANAVHVANAYSSMHYAERSSGAYFDPDLLETKLHGNNNNRKNLTSSTSPDLSHLFRYQTFDQAEESLNAQRLTAPLISNYESFFEESSPLLPPQPTKITNFSTNNEPLTLPQRPLQTSQ